mgnify:CR=1 FL=1
MYTHSREIKEEEKVEYMIHNPILPGFYPDPSACCVDNDFFSGDIKL